MTNAEKQEILNAIKAESQSVDELVEVSSLDNIKRISPPSQAVSW